MSLTIPARGVAHEQLFQRMNDLRQGDADWKAGRTFSLVYYAGPEHQSLLEEAYRAFSAENALNPMAFKSLRRMEAEVVRMTASMLNGGAKTCGTMTSGGTESILLAVKAARDRARKLRPRVKVPNLVAPETIHVAFDKAAQYFGVEIRYARVGADFRADVKDLAALVDANTVLIAASAPQYPHGVIDPIEEIATIAREKGIPMHVDACIGGFVLPWIERLGHPLPRWDFRVDGVTSISADLHKYGFAAKGASVIVYRDITYLRHQFFVSTDWPGGIYASPSIPGTRSGGAIAAAWAAMHAMGESGYVEHTERALRAAKLVAAGIDRIPELEVLGAPDATIVAWATKKGSGLDTYTVADRLEDLDWLVDRQQNPASIHCTMTSNHLAIVDEYLSDLREAVAYVKAHPEVKSRGNAAMYGMMAKVPFRGMVKKSVLDVMEKLYGPGALDDGDPIKDDDGVVSRLVKGYGARAMGVLDGLEDLRTRIFGQRRRR